MNWKAILMQGLMLAPGLVTSIDGIKGSNSDKKAKALQGVMLGMNMFQNVDPEDFERVFSKPEVQDAIGAANDSIHYALKVVDTVGSNLPAPSRNPSPDLPPLALPQPNSIIWDGSPSRSASTAPKGVPPSGPQGVPNVPPTGEGGSNPPPPPA